MNVVRELAFKRSKAIHDYNFLSDEEMFGNPLKHLIHSECIYMVDSSVATKLQLNNEVQTMFILNKSFAFKYL